VPDRELPTFPVVSVAVVIRDAATSKELFNVRADAPVQAGGKAATITDQIAQIFERYPAR
jgi:hypothetical protein